MSQSSDAANTNLTGTVESFAQRQALSAPKDFLAALSGPAVLVRLDERGGSVEPAAWAFVRQRAPDVASASPPSGGPRDDQDMSVTDLRSVIEESGLSAETSPDLPAYANISGAQALGDDDETLTVAPQRAAFSVPAARGAASVFVIPQVPAVLGRSARCEVCVDERSISMTHADVVKSSPGGGLAVVDRGSRNGVLLNGVRLKEKRATPLHNGDIVQLADVSFLFLDVVSFAKHLPKMMD